MGLLAACRISDAIAVRCLLDIYWDSQADRPVSPLHVAARYATAEVVYQLVATSPFVVDVNQIEAETEEAALHIAVGRGDLG